MTGSSPQPPRPQPPRPPRVVKRRRSSRGAIPWALAIALFVVYVLIGLLLSVPAPPVWVWIPAAIGTVLLSLGLNRPVVPGKRRDGVRLLAYLGALLLVVALAVATNYIGSGESFDNARFFLAIFFLGLLMLLAVVLTAVATIVNAQTGSRLMQTMSYGRSLTMVLGTCLGGLLIGGLAGFLTLTATTGS